MARSNPDHRIADVSFRDRRIACICGWRRDDVEIEVAWNGHRREHGLTIK